ncbi:GbsR/MarR family transcriptional regulator [Flavobacterium cellulosilyticum]|uniref:MarR family transcriptional regulator n=1 Tax=Flavobacterium cellulosilyticum TaxID=2541731 RepID=A0A4R5CCP9_9FLAO|nr:MarR family transcriptional regulator [Flavobacterium cellulosilyticum]TDD94934.1 MarR family transcriptional regulator [Flavobacterium cellulosilyticum]
MDIQKEKNELIEMFGIHFEKLYNIPPLAARILGTLIIDGCKAGLTFETLVETMNASKSSISTNLNLLLKMDKITYFTLCGDRKKYFKSADLSKRLENYLNLIDSEMTIITRMINYREQTASCPKEKCNLENVKAYKIHISEVDKSIRKTIEEFKKKEITNNKNQ